MKRASLILCAVALLVFSPYPDVIAQDDITKHPSCPYCGMDREKFGHSRIFISYEDGTTAGFCSIRCAAIDLAVNIDKSPKSIMVGDYRTKKLIDAETAFWVVGGDKTGVMTKRAKWAFAKQTEAELFMKESGGVPAAFEAVMKGTCEDMYDDTKMIRDRRKIRRQVQEKMQAPDHTH